jgi:hypothetical protein
MQSTTSSLAEGRTGTDYGDSNTKHEDDPPA